MLFSTISSLIITFDIILLMTYPYYRRNIFEGNFPTYGTFLEKNYWSKLNKEFSYGFLLGFVIVLIFSFFFNYCASITLTNIKNRNQDLIIYTSVFSIVVNLLFFYSFFKNRFYVEDDVELFLKYLFDTKFLTKTEFNEIMTNYQNDKLNFNVESLKDEMFKKAINKKKLLMHPFVGQTYYEINWIYLNLSSGIESFTDETYRILKLLVNSTKYNQTTFLKEFNDLKEMLFESGKLDHTNWTMLQILKIYLEHSEQ